MRKDEVEASRIMSTAERANSLRLVSIVEHCAALLTVPPGILRCRRRRSVVLEEEHKTRCNMPAACSTQSLTREAIEEHHMAFLAVPPILLERHNNSPLALRWEINSRVLSFSNGIHDGMTKNSCKGG